MKNTFKKAALALGTIATVAAPIAAVVSCGSGVDYSKSVVIKYTWAANGPQIKALKPVVDYYNKNVAKADDFKVKLVHVEGGYGKAVELDGRDMHQNNMGPVADAIIDYPDSLGTLASKALDFKKVEGGDTLTGLFDSPSYLTSEVENAGKDGVYSLPLAKSTEMLSIDIPFMAALEDANVVLTDGKVKAKVDEYRLDNKNKAEITKIVKSLGTITVPTPAIAINDKVVEDYDELMDASDEIAKAIANINAKATMHVLGEDSPTNLLYQLYNSRADYDEDKFIFHAGADGKFDYKALTTATSYGGKIIDGLLKEIQTHVNDGGLVINGAGAYSSSDFVDHKLPFVIGSTAGFSHNYKVQGAFGIKPATGDTVSLEGYNSEIVAPSAALVAKGAIAMSADKYHNPVYLSTFAGTLGEHDYISSDAATDTLITDAVNAEGTSMVLKSVKDAPAAADVLKGTYHYEFVSGKKVPVTASKDTSHVNPEEVLSLGAPIHSKVGSGTQKTQILSQGPSFIGIQHGGQKDVDTVKFMNWFFNKDSKITDANGNVTSPVDAFDTASGYITPIADAFDDANRSKYTDGNLISFDAFATVSKATDGIAFDNPVSRFSSDIRKSAEAAIKTIYTDAHGGVVTPATELYANFKDSFDLD